MRTDLTPCTVATTPLRWGVETDYRSATRIYLRKGRAEERVAKLQDSPDRPEKEASYQITEGGITDLGA